MEICHTELIQILTEFRRGSANFASKTNAIANIK